MPFIIQRVEKEPVRPLLLWPHLAGHSMSVHQGSKVSSKIMNSVADRFVPVHTVSMKPLFSLTEALQWLEEPRPSSQQMLHLPETGPWRRRLLEATALWAQPAVWDWFKAVQHRMPPEGTPDPVDPGLALSIRCVTSSAWHSCESSLFEKTTTVVRIGLTGRAQSAQELPPPSLSLEVPAEVLSPPASLLEAFNDKTLAIALDAEAGGSFHWRRDQSWLEWLERRGGLWSQEALARRLDKKLAAPSSRGRSRL